MNQKRREKSNESVHSFFVKSS